MQIRKAFALTMLASTLLSGGALAPSLLAQVQRVEMRVEGMT